MSGAARRRRRWWTEQGWWRHGSRLQTQLYVNCRHDELTTKVLDGLPTLAERRPRIAWVAPLKSKGFYEPRDGAMLRELQLEHLAPELARFWPAGGPVWDALAVCELDDGSHGVVLGEGKNYPRELYSGGTQAGKSGTRKALENRRRIERAVKWVQAELGAPVDSGRWLDPLDPTRKSSALYQTANRLAYAVWLRSQGVEAWLCHLLFVNDPLHHPTNEETWRRGLEKADRELGIDGLEIPFAGHVFLPALEPDQKLARPRATS